MAKSKTKPKKAPRKKAELPSFKLSNQQKLVLGSFLITLGIS
ncbi:cell division protein FtsK [Algibacter lectus]|uniref:Cell division protein FtsK n=2 Tax=Algibacter lectus TaxID=221126 RepID=A0A090X609_9FLAO|nr:cell division protein FtsK [Algibacter lectus]GAL80462.1 cell division protein FtsK [Algibacter lectus]